MHVEALLGDAAFRHVEAAIGAAEARTSGEIVFMIVERSDAYVGPRALCAAALAFAAGLIALATPLRPALSLPAVQASAFALAYAASSRGALLRPLLRREWRRAHVERAAGLAFLEHGIASTRARTGVLIYVSLLERQVAVLPDRGIASRVEPGVWDEVVERILHGIRAREAERGLSEAVQLCGDILAVHFPPDADHPNELPDTVLHTPNLRSS
jgi:putative membrane protein